MRHFRSDPVDLATIQRLVGVATLSPSVGSRSRGVSSPRPKEPARRAAVIASFERANAEALGGYGDEDAARYAKLKLAGLREAPVHLAVFCDRSTPAGKGLGQLARRGVRDASLCLSSYKHDPGGTKSQV